MNQKLSTMTKIPFIRLTIKRANRRKGGSKTLIFELKSVYVINAIIHSTGRYPCDQQHLEIQLGYHSNSKRSTSRHSNTIDHALL